MTETNDLKRLTERLFADDPDIDARIAVDTERYRKGGTHIELRHEDNTPVQQARIEYRLQRHDFHFGSNLYMLDEFPQPEQNQAYRRFFAEIFNTAVLPLYWTGTEPEEEKLRFRKDSPKVYRRPPLDLTVAYCQEAGLKMKGHPLFWHEYIPDWLANRSAKDMNQCLERRFAEIAERYGRDIGTFDVVNELLTWRPDRFPLPDNPLELAFEAAERHFPLATRLCYSEVTAESWRFNGCYTPVELVIERLLHRGRRLSGIGMQYHQFYLNPTDMLLNHGDETLFNPRYLFKVMDSRARFGLPLQISEITLSGRDSFGGDDMQARIAERLYRIWFSHPACDGIFYWNLVEGTNDCGAPLNSEEGENIHHSGLLHYDFTPKPIYKVLKKLLHKEWNSHGILDYARDGTNYLCGFHGDYQLRITENTGQSHVLSLGLHPKGREKQTLILKKTQTAEQE